MNIFLNISRTCGNANCTKRQESEIRMSTGYMEKLFP